MPSSGQVKLFWPRRLACAMRAPGPEKYRDRGIADPRKGAICQEGKALPKGDILEGEPLSVKVIRARA